MHDVLLDRWHHVPGSGRVRLRLSRPADVGALHGLLGRLGLTAEDLELRRLLRCEPGRSLTVCALAWDGTRERLVCAGRLAVADGALTVLAEDPAVGALVAEALRDHARTWARRVA